MSRIKLSLLKRIFNCNFKSIHQHQELHPAIEGFALNGISLAQKTLQLFIFDRDWIKFKLNQRSIMINRAFQVLNILVIHALSQLVFLKKDSKQGTYQYFNIIFGAHVLEQLLEVIKLNVLSFLLCQFIYLSDDIICPSQYFFMFFV